MGNQTGKEVPVTTDGIIIHILVQLRKIKPNSVLRFIDTCLAKCGRAFVEDEIGIVKRTNENSMFVRKEGGDGQEEFEFPLTELLGKILHLQNHEYIFFGARWVVTQNFETIDGTSVKVGFIIVIKQYYRKENGKRIIKIDLERAGHSNRTWNQPKEIRLQDISKMQRLHALWSNEIVECSQRDEDYKYGVVICSYPLQIKLCTEYHDSTISPRFYKYVRKVTEDIQNQQRALMTPNDFPIPSPPPPPAEFRLQQGPPPQPAEFRLQQEQIQTPSQSQSQPQTQANQARSRPKTLKAPPISKARLLDSIRKGKTLSKVKVTRPPTPPSAFDKILAEQRSRMQMEQDDDDDEEDDESF